MNNSAFFVTPKKTPGAAVRLFCFPFAGGDIATYLPWLELLDPRLELVIVQLPGRGKRQHEKPFTQMEPLVDALFAAMFSAIDKPFAFFGHSMGSKIAFELAKRLQQNQFPCPRHFFASGCASPCLSRRIAPVHRLPDTAFIQRLTQLSGVPQAVLDNRELMQFLLPMLRADFKLVETYVGKADTKIPSRITPLGGANDVLVDTDELQQWTDHFEQSNAVRVFQGGHFYLHQFSNEVTQTINSTLFQNIEHNDTALMPQAVAACP
ncbi:MAG: alpha/beta fold hydrolase [Ketobacter sp.]|nr:MAG: thioesterase [Ketobacter sp.]